VCKEYFKHYPYEDREFCSRECKHKDMRKERATISCKRCSDSFEVVSGNEERRTFCSKDCYSDYISDNPEKFNLFQDGHSGYDSSPWQGKSLSENHRQKISETMKGITRSEEYIKQNLLGENHWNWQGGKSYEEYPKGRIRASNCFKCLNCGKSQEENISSCGKRLEVHHLNERKEDVSKSNLVPLCTECHTRHHNSDSFKLVIK